MSIDCTGYFVRRRQSRPSSKSRAAGCARGESHTVAGNRPRSRIAGGLRAVFRGQPEIRTACLQRGGVDRSRYAASPVTQQARGGGEKTHPVRDRAESVAGETKTASERGGELLHRGDGDRERRKIQYARTDRGPSDIAVRHQTARDRCRKSGKSVTVRVNDRGPYVPGRVVDVSYSAASACSEWSARASPM